MFGYVTPLKPELKIREFETFRSYYCGLCMSIKKNFGNMPRMILNYDMTFLGLLLDSLYDDDIMFKMKRCMAHPQKKKPMILENKALDYAAALNVSLIYYKLNDDVLDDNSIKGKVGMMFLSPYKKKFSESVATVNKVIEENLNKLSSLEKEKNFCSIDEIADPFSTIVGKILELYPEQLPVDNEDIRNNLYNLGYGLGKWIYIIDALDDLEEDMNKNKFNPINFLYNSENKSYDELIKDIKDRIEFTILNCGYNCKEALENLPVNRNKPILENIISLGMMDRYTKIISQCNCKKK